ncbi:hypothetical protein [Methylocystis parvus]|uniref:hypothetical protein n=1 Tax=Methylocystis parvus TaxID=134 RepID=UPI0003659A39|nr:hypothetical protein [Methylocystis parvus]WBK00327.1 hypothetical protein MMG94_00965 [Methylocystis parvus OBBP]
MDDPLPAQTDTGRPSLLRKPSPAPSDKVSSIVAAENGRDMPADLSGKAPLDQRMASLATALRKARIENAEHSAALADLRAAEIVRLEMLADALSPVLAQLPRDCDIFDVAVSPGERPRLFIDQIGFVEMDRDRRTYRFLQDTRHGRITLRETADIDETVDAATNYIAHRLIEREKALAVDYASGGAARVVRKTAAPDAVQKTGLANGKVFEAFLFFIEFLGSAAFFGLLAIIAMWVYKTYFS